MRIQLCAAAAAAAALLMVGCSPSDDPTETPTPTPSATTTSPAPTPTSASPTPTTEGPTPTPSETLDADQIAARDVVNEFFRLYVELSQNPEAPLQPLADVTTGQTQELYVADVADLRQQGAVLLGDIGWQITSVGSVRETSGPRIVQVDACTDATGTDVVIVDTGVSIVAPDRPDFLIWSIDATEVSEGVWLVGDLTTTDADACPE